MERAGPGDRRRRRALAGHLLRSVASVTLLTALYYLAPLDRGIGVGTVVAFVLGLVLFGWLTARQIAAITHAEYPRLRAIEAVATAVPLFLVLFSATYYLLADNRPSSFSEPLSRTDALYFTVTVFATVGFGDIVPTTGAGRALATVQMLADLIVVGVVAKVLFGAVRVGLRRRGTAPEDPGEEP
ncbi:transporter [Streptomyces sp. ERV7]|uniref:potassium channel family protein n=1 Tax=Streptomyces sp. ERV7 TaxID=1322334 RepID=UPI0007F4A8F9|nr:potassium channel family protein [Streptomyces sp. ERV7]OAR23485.1 transporter [Streptomyces sp. ERV7]